MVWGQPPFVDCSPCDGLLTANSGHCVDKISDESSPRLAAACRENLKLLPLDLVSYKRENHATPKGWLVLRSRASRN